MRDPLYTMGIIHGNGQPELTEKKKKFSFLDEANHALVYRRRRSSYCLLVLLFVTLIGLILFFFFLMDV